jgi:4'-phosphopantetheinyl transferase
MPLMSVEEVVKGVRLGLWNITESVDEFLLQGSSTSLYRQAIIDSYRAVGRRREALAVRSLIDVMVGDDVGLLHEKSGKPYLSNGMNISISHTKGCAAVVISRERVVAVDVECLDGRVTNVAGKMLRPDENADTLTELLLHWCAKETLYKLYSEEHLALKDMRVLSIGGDDTHGIIKTENVQRGETSDVYYRIFDGKVLTYAVL